MIHDHCDVLLTTGCSTHVHMSPTVLGGFQPDDLLRLMKAIAFFEDPIRRVMPPERKDNEWAKSNFLPNQLLPRNLSEAYARVSSETWGYLFLICDKHIHEIKKRKQLWKVFAIREIFPDKYLSWNIIPLGDCGTIEFRRPPGVSNALDASHWVAFSLGFMCSALSRSLDKWRSTRSNPPVIELFKFIDQGLLALGPITMKAFQSNKMFEDQRQPPRTTPQELATIKMQKEQFRKKKSPFAEKVCSL